MAELRYDSKFRPAPAFGGPQPESHAKPAQQIKKVDWDVQSKELDEMFDKQTEQQLKELPNMSMPIQFKDKVSLYQHQIDGIKWLVHQENKMNESNGKGNNPFFKEVHEGKRKVSTDILSHELMTIVANVTKHYIGTIFVTYCVIAMVV